MEFQIWAVWHPLPTFEVDGKARSVESPFLTKDWIGVPSKNLKTAKR